MLIYLQCGLLGSPIPFGYRTFAVQRQNKSSRLPWPLVVHTVLAFYRYTAHTIHLLFSQVQRYSYPKAFLFVSLNFFDRLAALYAQSRPVTLPRQRLTAAAGTLLARDSSRYCHDAFPRLDFTAALAFMTFVDHLRDSLVQAFAHWPIFPTAAGGGILFHFPCGWATSQPN